MHVLHVISSLTPEYGGPAVALVGLIAAQRKLGTTVTVIATFREGDNRLLVDELRATGVGVVLIGPVSGPLQRQRNLRSTAHTLVSNADVIHIHGVWEELQFQCTRAAERLRRPYIIRPCGMLDPWSLKQGRLKKAIYRQWRLDRMLTKANAIHFTTRAEQKLAAPVCSGLPALVEPNGLSSRTDPTVPRAQSFRRKHGIPADQFLFLFLSRIHPKKGLDVLLPAFAAVDRSRVHLAIVGSGTPEHMAALEDSVRRLGLSSRVILTGMLTGVDKAEAYAAANAFVLPSYQENFGNVVIEATASGLPVLISEHVNLSEAVTASKVGEVIPLSVERFAAAMERWSESREHVAAYQENCRRFAEQFQWDEIAKHWNDHYRGLVADRSGIVPHGPSIGWPHPESDLSDVAKAA